MQQLWNTDISVFETWALGIPNLGTGVHTLLGGAASGTGGPVGSIGPTILNPIFTGLNGPLLGNGSGAITAGTISGNTHAFMTADGPLTSGHCLQADGSDGVIDAGNACGSGGGGSGTVSAGLTNNLGWYSAGGTTIAPLATANNGILATNGG